MKRILPFIFLFFIVAHFSLTAQVSVTFTPPGTQTNPTVIRKSTNPAQISYTATQAVNFGGQIFNLPLTLCDATSIPSAVNPTATTTGATTVNTYLGHSGPSTGTFSILADKATTAGTNFSITYTIYTLGLNSVCTPTTATEYFTVVENLPIELSYFNAKLLNSATSRVDWTTASELNNDFFVVERSTDGKNFISTSRLKGAGSTTKVNTYSFEDSNLPNNSSVAYYRLKSVDFSGNADYSKVVAVNLGKAKNFNLVNILNSPDKSTVQYETPSNGDMNISVFNLNGQIVQQFKTSAVQGYNEVSVDKNTLSSGVYMVNINNGAQSLNAKIVKF